MGQCKTKQNEDQYQFSNKASYHSSFSKLYSSHKNKNEPPTDFALPYTQEIQLSEKIQERLKQLGPFNYQKCGQFENGQELQPYRLKNEAIYSGQWKNGCTHGKGKFYLPDKSYFEGISHNNQIQGWGRIIHQNGDYYEGQLKQGMANGQGIYVEGPITYNGMFKNNLQHGQGVQFSDEYQFKGIFREGQKEKGTLTLKNKDKYEYQGDFKDNKFHGYGTLINDVGKYEGHFQRGVKEGMGKFIWSDGSYYEGNYVNDEKQGQGRLYDKKGKLLKNGRWHKNNFQG